MNILISLIDVYIDASLSFSYYELHICVFQCRLLLDVLLKTFFTLKAFLKSSAN